jgi:hypothetical protein
VAAPILVANLNVPALVMDGAYALEYSLGAQNDQTLEKSIEVRVKANEQA